jgi:Tfp pilus assembly protein PilF
VALFQLDAASAAKSLRQALDLEPADVDSRLLLAQAAMLQGRVRHARTLLQEAAALEPSNDQAQCMLGWACAGENDIDGAEAAFERALDIEAGADALSGRACVALARGEAERARQAAEQALALVPDHALARLLLSRTEELAGHRAQADELLREVLHSSPFGPLGADVATVMRGAAEQPMVRRLQRRVALARRKVPPSAQP